MSSTTSIPYYRQVVRCHDGDYLIARTLYPAVVSALGLGDDDAEGGVEIPTKEKCAEVLAYSPWDEINIAAAMIRFMGNPPFMDQLDHAERQQEIQNKVAQFGPENMQHSISVYRKAVEANPDDWQLHFNFSRLYDDFKMPQPAVSQFENVIRLMPYTAPQRLRYAVALGKVRKWDDAMARKWDDAMAQLTEALRLDPDYSEAREAMEWIQAQQQ